MNKIENLIKNAERIVVLYHIDTDGVCSAKIVAEALRRLNKNIIDFFPSSPKLLKSKSFQKGITLDNPDLIIIVDVGVEEDEPIIINNKEKNFLIMDHHPVTKDLSNEKIIHINPRLTGEKKFVPASKVCFDEMNKIVDIKDLDWVCATGIVGDSGGPDHKIFINKVIDKYKFERGKDNKYFFDSFLGELSQLINGAKMIKGNDGASKALKLLEKSSNAQEFYDSAYELREWNDKINSYIEEMKKNFENKKECYKHLELCFFTFKPKFMIGSTLSTIISFKHQNETIIIFTKKNGKTTVNLRRQDKKYDMGTLAKNSVKGLRYAGGGGHAPAAGAHIQTKDMNYMKRNIVREIKKLISS